MADDGQVLYLRAEVVLRAQIDDQEVETALVPHRVSYHEGSHTKARECSVEIHGSVLPYPLEHTAAVFASVFFGVASTVDGSVRSPENLRFCGYFQEEEVDDEARLVSFKALDLSQLLREHAPLVPALVNGRRIDPTPRYSDTLEQAIGRILSVVPSFADAGAKSPLTLRQNDALATASLGALVDGRAKRGPIALPPKASAWVAIEHVCGLAARLVGVELDEIVVRTPRDAFAGTGASKYTFVFGAEQANAYGPRRHKLFTRNRKGVRVVAWNPETRKRMEAVFPSDDVMRTKYPRKRPTPQIHKPGRTSHTRAAKPPKEPERETYALGAGVFTQAQLVAHAERIWLERATQEVDGTLSTPIWDAGILNLHNGDRVTIRVRPELEAEIQRTTSDDAAAAILVERLGVDKAAARILVQLARRPHDDLWYVRTVTHEWPSAKASTIGFINLLRV